MKAELKLLIKCVLPGFILNHVRKRNAVWTGNFASWESASSVCEGYSQENILRKVDESTAKIISGEHPYERDSVLFAQIVYSWPALSGLLWSNSLQRSLHVVDFGGALGSTYYQNQKFLKGLDHSWSVIEQKNFVDLGKQKYQTQNLKFFESIDACLADVAANTLHISSTLQYLPDPQAFLSKLMDEYEFPIIILDRISVLTVDPGKHRLTKQVVSEKIYRASYPTWFFSEALLIKTLSKKYDIVEVFDSYVFNETYIDGAVRSTDRGYILRRKT